MKIQLKFKNIFFILLGAAIFSFGLVHFNMQNQLAEGGFTGITLLLYFLFHINPSFSNLILNIPVFFLGWKYLGRSTFYYTIIGTVAVSIFLEIFQRYQYEIPLNGDLTLAALFAGVFIGIGLGIIFRNGGTTGGVDIIARLVQKYIGWSIGKTMFIFDTSVITLSVITYLNPRQAMYTLVAVYIAARVIDIIQEGAYAAKGAFIVSDRHEEIGKRIISDLNRGVTVLHGRGFYSKKTKNVLYCVVAQNELGSLKNLVNSVDPHAFITISNVHDVLGEGFTLDENKNPIER
ncbi:YitT family protein [Fervidibacillus halotolerans]|uniref:YitT family protein n=1 Tax=Fervidibacillus halotolerans TaxID=2980027 RepID=A0A9E8M2B3_9BACI|nr:YitT family protein [Fervidibacillus halotolerans]WAA13747.1 YitT family protein [Fervidibacillus halotolerans]